MATIKEQIAAIGVDLLNLEINTIVKANISGRKMPSPVHALIDIAGKYRLKLSSMGDLQEDFEVNRQSLAGYQEFDEIREHARMAIEKLEGRAGETAETAEDERDRLMLWRIKTMSDQLKAICKSYDDTNLERFDRENADKLGRYPFDANHLTVIRKAWEVGTEEIAMQTVVQIDGDVITRVHPYYAKASNDTLLDLHKEGVDISLAYWKELITLAKDFLSGLLDKVIGKR